MSKPIIKILHLPLKARWYEMQESGEKPEEYREITGYWVKRFLKDFPVMWRIAMDLCIAAGDFTAFHGKEIHPIYTHVCFRYGYTKRCFINKIDSITIGRGNPEWGAPTDRDVFIIKHHKESSPFTVSKDFKTYTDEQLKAMSKADANFEKL